MRVSPINIIRNRYFCFRSSNPKIVIEPSKDEFVRSSDSIDISRLQDLEIAHFRLFDSNSIRGISLADKKPRVLEELKASGIHTVIDLRQEGGEETPYARRCEDNGLKYFSLKMKPNTPIFNDVFSSKLTTEERDNENAMFISKLPYFFEIMNNGGFYIHCLLGLHRTDLAACLNYLVNPKEPLMPPTLSHMHMNDENNHTMKYISKIKKMIQNLTQKDAEFLHLTEGYKDIFSARVVKLKMMNGIK